MPTLRKLRQEDFEFKAYKGCTVRLSSNNDNNDEQTISRQMSLLLYVIHFVILSHSHVDPETARPSSSKITTTLGLVVHAAGKSELQ